MAAGVSEKSALPDRRAFLTALGASTLAAPSIASARQAAQVIVIGAGISGLETALLLEARGFDVLVLEASNRIGGRLQTWTDLPGSPNAGGVQVGASYRRLRSRAAALNVQLFAEPTAPRGNRIAIGNALIDPASWPASPLNPFPAAFKSATPASALFTTGARANPLVGFDDWRGAKGIAADVSAERFLQDLGFEAEACRLVDAGLNGNTLSSYSMLNTWRTMTLFAADRATGGGSSMIEGGSQALPEAMAKALKRPVMLGQRVSAISVSNRGARVQIGNRTLQAQAVVAAVPFPALRTMKVRAPLSAPTREAIDGLAYTQIIQTVIEPASKFWLEDGLPIDMWTDGPFERLFSIRDSAGSDTGQVMIWLNGTGASAQEATLGRARPGSELPELQRVLNTLRPASGGRHRIIRTQHWTASNPLAGGAYMNWAPGQIARWAGQMGLPAGRLYFAGEHLGLVHTGMEAAFESAHTCADQIATSLGAG
jgi:monoamine oxidase